MNVNTIRQRIPQPTEKPKTSLLSTQKPVTTKGAIVSIVLCSLMLLYYLFVNSRTDINRTLHETSSVYKTWKVKDISEDGISDINTEYMYEFPEDVEIHKAKAIVFFAHGCSHSATDFFEASEACPQCLGLPEERALIHAFLKEKYIVIAISSHNRISKCWNRRTDTAPVREVLLHFKDEFDIGGLQVYVFGASSGGSFAGALATNNEFVTAVGLAGVMVQIAAINVGFNELSESIFVPVLFIPMRKDGRVSGIVSRQIEILQAKGDKVSQVCWVKEAPIGSLYFFRKSGGEVTVEDSEKIYNALKENGYLNDEMFLIEDPRLSDWRYVVRSSIGEERLNEMFDTLVADESGISEEMNVAYAVHEISAQCVPEMLEFVKSTQEVV